MLIDSNPAQLLQRSAAQQFLWWLLRLRDAIDSRTRKDRAACSAAESICPTYATEASPGNEVNTRKLWQMTSKGLAHDRVVSD